MIRINRIEGFQGTSLRVGHRKRRQIGDDERQYKFVRPVSFDGIHVEIILDSNAERCTVLVPVVTIVTKLSGGRVYSCHEFSPKPYCLTEM